jgi:hypothetical protein
LTSQRVYFIEQPALEIVMRRFMLSMLACFGLMATAACGTSVEIEPGFVILDTSPSGGAVNVDPAVELFVVLSQDVDATSLPSVTLEDSEGAAIAATVSQLSDKHVLSIMPDPGPLGDDAAYVLTIAGTLKSSSGETLDATITKRFRTAP